MPDQPDDRYPLLYGNLTAMQAGTLALRAGFTEADAITLVAIGWAESRLNASKVNHNIATGDESYGWLQINMIGQIGVERRTKYGLARNEDLLEAGRNTAVARAIWKEAGNKFTDWSTYNHGTYRAGIAIAQFGVKQALAGKPWWSDFTDLDFIDPSIPNPIKGAKDAVKDVGGAIGDVGSAVGKIGDFITNSENWLRVAAAVGGGLLVILAILLLLADTVLGQVIKKAARVTKRASA